MTQELMQKMADRYKFMRDNATDVDADIMYELTGDELDNFIDARIEEVKAEGEWK